MNEAEVDRLTEELSKTIKTTCPYCGVGCGVLAKPMPDGTVEIKGDENHPANFGRLCSKGSSLGETLSLDDRLLVPKIKGEEVNWEKALGTIADEFSSLIKEEGPGSVAMYVSGQFLTEDYYVANKFMKGAIGTANIDTNSRLCMSSSVAGHKRAFGTDTVPNSYDDLEKADVIILVGSNLTWCHPILFQRIEAEKQKRDLKLICIDPRRTTTASASDMHLGLNPGTDVALFNGLLAHLYNAGIVDHEFIEANLEGESDTKEAAFAQGLDEIADITGLTKSEITEFYETFANTEKVMTLYSQGVNQSSNGTDKVNAILNCHLSTGRIGKEGCGPLSLTGQPNAMGGREVGGLANQLAAHMELKNEKHRDIVQRFWGVEEVPSKPGLNAVELFEAVKDGKVKAIWIMATNPVDSLPDADMVREALKLCPLVIVSDVTQNTDTAECADILLPTLGWGEKSGTVTNSERRISRQRAFLSAPGEAKADWWQITEVARRMGFEDLFRYESAKDVFCEHAALSDFENEETRDFNIGPLKDLSSEDYDELEPVQWPCSKDETGEVVGQEHLFADGCFFTESKKAKLVPTPYKEASSKTSIDYPLILNTGRIRDQWHTMTRTAKTPRLMRHIGEPFVELCKEDAQKFEIKDAAIVELKSEQGTALLRARITDAQTPGTIFSPLHWTDQFASSARIDALVAKNVDPFSGQPESKFTPCSIKSLNPSSYGLFITQDKPDIKKLRELSSNPKQDYWALMPIDAGWAVECAGDELINAGQTLLSALLGFDISKEDEPFEFIDPQVGNVKRAYFNEAELRGVLFIGPAPINASRVFMKDLLSREFITTQDKFSVLTGRPSKDAPDKGAIICSCFNVGVNEIRDAIENHNCTTVKAIGKKLNAGTNCGSCKTELAKLIETSKQKVAAE
jgi:assimilatory nitrate reductase catalytic subunit